MKTIKRTITKITTTLLKLPTARNELLEILDMDELTDILQNRTKLILWTLEQILKLLRKSL